MNKKNKKNIYTQISVNRNNKKLCPLLAQHPFHDLIFFCSLLHLLLLLFLISVFCRRRCCCQKHEMCCAIHLKRAICVPLKMWRELNDKMYLIVVKERQKEAKINENSIRTKNERIRRKYKNEKEKQRDTGCASSYENNQS